MCVDSVLTLLNDVKRLVVLTGAGMSQESDVATFRDPTAGLWARFDPTQLATPEAFRRDPARVFGWYLWRWRQVARAVPHAGYRALVAMEQVIQSVTIVTQNVDGLHRRAGSSTVIELHGSLDAFRCAERGHPYDALQLTQLEQPEDGAVEPPRCHCGAPIRPGVVWFGEVLPEAAFDRAMAAAECADAVLVVGTSSVVYPAAALPGTAAAHGAAIVEINPHPTQLTASADYAWAERAGVALPLLAEGLGCTLPT
jgi:NAD-dependent deacetylase